MPRTKRTEPPTESPAPAIGHNSAVTDNDLIAENHRLEDQIKAGMAKFNEWSKPLKERIKAIEDDIFARLVARGADSTKTDAGTAYISRLATVKIESAELLFDFAADHWEAYGDEIKVVISKAGVDKHMEDHNGELPPGVSLSKFSKLNIRRS